MRIIEVSYGFTKSLPGYQSQRVDARVQINDEMENPDEALDLAVAFVNEALEIPLSENQKSLLSTMRAQGGIV
jgi:hypothetical protein